MHAIFSTHNTANLFYDLFLNFVFFNNSSQILTHPTLQQKQIRFSTGHTKQYRQKNTNFHGLEKIILIQINKCLVQHPFPILTTHTKHMQSK